MVKGTIALLGFSALLIWGNDTLVAAETRQPIAKVRPAKTTDSRSAASQALDAATASKRRGEPATHIAAQIKTEQRLNLISTARTLRQAGYSAKEALPALITAFKVSSNVALSNMSRVGFDRREIANLQQVSVPSVRREELVSRTPARDPGGEVYLEIPCGGQRVTGDAVGSIRHNFTRFKRGGSVDVCAQPGWKSYQWSVSTAINAGGQNRFVRVNPRGNRSRFTIPANANYHMDTRSSVYQFFTVKLTVTGIDGTTRDIRSYIQTEPTGWPGTPVLTDWKIGNYRPGGGDWIRQQGVVDPALVNLSDPDAGKLVIQGRNLLANDVRIVGAEVIDRRPGNPEEMTLRFDSVSSRRHTLSSSLIDRLGIESRQRLYIKRLGYNVQPANLFNAFLGDAEIRLGDPRGQSQITMAGRTRNETLERFTGLGFDMELLSMASTSVSVEMRETPEPRAMLVRLNIEFEGNGQELTGTFAQTIPGFRCSGFSVAESQCSGVNIPCFVGEVGAALSNNAHCLNPANWRSVSLSGPNVDVGADVTNPRLIVDFVMLTEPNGRVDNARVSADFRGDINLVAAGISAPTGFTGPAFRAFVSAKISQQLAAAGTGQQIAEFMNEIVNVFADDVRVRDLVVMPDGRLFMDLED